MTNFADVLADLTKKRESGWTYERIGTEFGINKTTIWKIINLKTQPIDPSIRKRLGLPKTKEVNFLSVDPRTDRIDQIDALKIEICPECGRAFVSNHPCRKKCFICSPYRRRK